MAITLGKNISSIGAQRQLGRTTSLLSTTSERLSSGLRINHAADDAAGLAVSQSLNANVRVYGQAVRNLNDGISLLNVAEGALSELSHITSRHLELAEQAANGTYSSVQRQALDQEARALTSEYNRIVSVTRFNGQQLLTGTKEVALQAGFGSEALLKTSIGTTLAEHTPAGTFSAPQSFGTDPIVNFGDFNGDGITDLLSKGNYSFTTQLGNGDGTFRIGGGLYVYYSGNQNGGSPQTGIADFNGDGIMDVVSDRFLFTGIGDGSFNPRIDLTVNSAFGTFLGDYNNDGNIDLGAADLSGDLIIQLGNGDGTFKASQTVIHGVSTPPTMGDLNRDGFEDLLIDNNTIALGNGDGTFRISGSLGLSTNASLFADFNGDGVLDIASRWTPAGGHLFVFLGNGDGSFKAGLDSPMGGLTEIVSGDFNNDGVTDLLAMRGGQVTLLPGKNDGTFDLGTSLISGVNDFLLSDVNDDDIPDIIGNTGGSPFVSFAEYGSRMTVDNVDLTSASTARSALDELGTRLGKIAAELGNLGSFQSRIQSATAAIQATKDNYQAASTRITDADLASETAAYTSLLIKQKTAAAVLAQANQVPALAFTLLKIF